MTSNTTSRARTGAGGCGCGGGLALSPFKTPNGQGSCSCGCGGCESCQAESSFVRPRFFPGQLLTEEDLEQLTSYVSAKSRLHNRFLYGEGVVCGLAVTCDPCGGGNVRVSPGYALDCCGNDIVVGAERPLDVNKMVAELLRRRNGADCGDPCAPVQQKKKLDAESSSGTAERVPSRELTVETPETRDRTYCLYVRYCEQATHPVAPYTTDDPCAAQACQFSRVQEGYSFELRCAEEDPKRTDLLRTLLGCIEPFTRSKHTLRVAAVLGQRGSAISAAVPRAPLEGVYNLQQEDISAAQQEVSRTLPVDETLEARALRAERYASLVIRSDMRMAEQPTDPAFDVLRERLLGSKNQSGLADQLLGDMHLLGLPPLTRTLVTEIANMAKRWAPKQQNQELYRQYEARLLAGGVALNSTMSTAFRAAIIDMKQKLIAAASANRSDCQLLEEIQSVLIPPASSGQPTQAEAEAISAAIQQLWRVALRYLKDCACMALLPRCAPCDDPAVLLACITVRDCEVLEICNLSRRFVLTPAATRYWLGSIFDLLGSALEQVCCGTEVPRFELPWSSPEQPRKMVRERAVAAPDRAPGAGARSEGMDLSGVLTRLSRGVELPPEVSSLLGGQSFRTLADFDPGAWFTLPDWLTALREKGRGRVKTEAGQVTPPPAPVAIKQPTPEVEEKLEEAPSRSARGKGRNPPGGTPHG